jgi:hypothetical protein
VAQLLLTALVACSAAVTNGAEVHIHFSALERLLSQQMFTEDGRRYVRGDRNAKCNFAWLEKPRVSGENGKLIVRARFTGRTAFDVFGRCVGLGDSFDLKITALPTFDRGHIGLRDVEASPEAHSGFYASRVCESLAASLRRDFRYPLAADVRRAFEDPGTQPEWKRELRRFHVPKIYITKDAVAVALDFEVVVK